MAQSGRLKAGIQRVTPDMPAGELAYMAAYMTQSTTAIRKAVCQRWGGYLLQELLPVCGGYGVLSEGAF